ncbi:MAG: DUF262 domain-containing protein, partial [Pyrinomonadaceae bacterium]
RHSIWTNEAQSKLIESVLLRIPLPAFYFDATNEDRWVVVDGLQRLTALTRFIIRQDLRLKGLEYLDKFEGRTYQDLPRNYQRRIAETQVTVFLIEKETPPDVKFNIFKRINTGGMPLSAQEIRHALNQGPATKLLAEVSNSTEFKKATSNSIKSERMADREFVLRFLAFTITPYIQYEDKDMDAFLNAAMASLNNMSDSERRQLVERFYRALYIAHELWDNYAFRKPGDPLYKKKSPINKALFEAVTVNLGALDDFGRQRLVDRKTKFLNAFNELLKDPAYDRSISQATGDVRQVHMRFGRIANIIKEVIA